MVFVGDVSKKELEKCLFGELYDMTRGKKHLARLLYHQVFQHIPGYDSNLSNDDVGRKWRDYQIYISRGRIIQSPITMDKPTFDNFYILFKGDRFLLKESFRIDDKKLDEFLREYGYHPKKKLEHKGRTKIATPKHKTGTSRGISSRKGDASFKGFNG